MGPKVPRRCSWGSLDLPIQSQPPPTATPSHPQVREAELSDMLSSTQSSLEAMQRLYAAAQNQLFELTSNKEAAVVVKQVGGGNTARPGDEGCWGELKCVDCLALHCTALHHTHHHCTPSLHHHRCLQQHSST